MDSLGSEEPVPDVSLDEREQEARIRKLIAEIRHIEVQTALYPIVITSGFLLGVAAVIKIFL